MKDLQDRLLDAHDAGDPGVLAQLYAQAADAASTEEAQGFYLTHAYVFALEAGIELADTVRQQLIEMGREPGPDT